jgi:hypothetical protein
MTKIPLGAISADPCKNREGRLGGGEKGFAGYTSA